MNKIETIIQELYIQNEEFKKYDKELRNIIAKVLESKPNVIIDQELKQQIINQLLNKEKLTNKIMNFTFKPVYIGWGIAVVALVVLIPFLTNTNPLPNTGELTMVGNNAFGSLSWDSLSLQIANNSKEALGMGGGGFSTDAEMVSREDMAIMTESAIYPYPYYTQYQYKYVGDDFDLSDDKVKVYQRKPGLGTDIYGSDILKSIDAVDLSLFKNAKVENIQLTQDNGYMIFLDFNRGSISINKDYRISPMTEMSSNMIAIENIPSDDEIIKISNDFLKKYKVDLSNYGDPIVNKYWLDYPEYEIMSSRQLFSQSIQITYPLVIDDNIVKDQGGNGYGLNVSVDISQKKVTGIYNLTSQRYDVSMYDGVTDKQEVLDIVERGGIYGGRYYDDQAKTVIGLVGSPELILMNYYRYDGYTDYEMYVPALLFPVIGWESEDKGYTKNIVVPLVKELMNYDQPILYKGAVPEPMPMIDIEVSE